MDNMSTIVFQTEFQTTGFNVPYVTLLEGGIQAGKAIFLQGAFQSDSFVVNLKCGPTDGDDIAFHIKPVKSINSVVLNSCQNGSWGKEEKLPLPLKHDGSFDLIIVANYDNFQVFVNGAEVGKFNHRIPLERISVLDIGGQVTLANVVLIESWSTSSFAANIQTTPVIQTTTIIQPTPTIQTISLSKWSPSTIHSQLLMSIQKPALPYVGSVAGVLGVGAALYMQGVAFATGPGFTVDFKTGKGDSDDIAFHFNPRLNSNVVMNTFRNGGWEAEEFGPDNPFKTGEAFEIFFVFRSDGYLVYVNGREYYLFQHRIPLGNVSALNIAGNVVMNVAGFIKNWYSLGFLRWGLSTIQSEFLHAVQYPSLPYVGKFPLALRAGLALYFHGVAGTTGERFAINFRTGPTYKDDIAFHFNPRYNSIVALNCFRNGGWEAEESVSDNPFKLGQAFEMFIVIKTEGYQVYMNGKEYCLFRHRIDLGKVSAINIEGDVTMNLFAFIQSWSTSSFAAKIRPTPTIKTTPTIQTISLSKWSPSTIHSQLLMPIQKPALPYVGSVAGVLGVGVALYMQGVAFATGPGFTINFKTGKGDSDDIAFHFNPRLNSNVVMNTFRNGGWEAEEFGPDNPFKTGEAFEIFFVFRSDGYLVYVNGREYYLFQHRIPLGNVSVLSIAGNVVVNVAGFIKNWYSLGFLRWGLSTIQSEFKHAVQYPSIPYVGKFPLALRAGLALYFHGVAGTTGDRFAISFRTGPTYKDDIAFHFNPRYNSIVALNSFRNGGWEAEESVSDNPFKLGQAFEMFIVIKAEGYQVYMNGKEYCLFRHRIDLGKVSAISIEGDVTMNLFAFIQNWDKSPFCTKMKGLLRSFLSSLLSKLLHSVKSPGMPYQCAIPGGVKPGMCFYMQGTVPINAAGFSVNFKLGQGESDDNAFHFNPRINSNVVLNTFRNGGWETEEFAPTNPFTIGQTFDLFICFTPHGYKVHVNGQERCFFKHRMPLNKVNTLLIKGDISVVHSGFMMGTGAGYFEHTHYGTSGGYASGCTTPQTHPGCIPPSHGHGHGHGQGHGHGHGHGYGHGHGFGHGHGHHKKC